MDIGTLLGLISKGFSLFQQLIAMFNDKASTDYSATNKPSSAETNTYWDVMNKSLDELKASGIGKDAGLFSALYGLSEIKDGASAKDAATAFSLASVEAQNSIEYDGVAGVFSNAANALNFSANAAENNSDPSSSTRSYSLERSAIKI